MLGKVEKCGGNISQCWETLKIVKAGFPKFGKPRKQ